MSSWKQTEWDEPIHLFLVLTNDAGHKIGCIMQFYEGGVYYPISNKYGRYGPRRTLEDAKAAVESVLPPDGVSNGQIELLG